MNNTDITVYKENGQITKCIISTPDSAELYLEPGESYVIGRSDLRTQYIEKGLIIDMPPRPAGDYQFDYGAKAWIFDTNSAIETAMRRRHQELLASDWTQLPDAPVANKEAWAAYRQALRDITNQPGYPQTIDWPIAPN